MGVVKRQGIKHSIVNYIGVAIGAFSTLFIYSQSTETYGFARFILDTAALLVPIVLLGAGSVAIKFFPDFKNEDNGHNGFLSFLLSFAVVGSIILLAGLYIFYDQLIEIYSDKPIHYRNQLFKIGIIAVLAALLSLLINYVANFHRIAVPTIFTNFIKISLPILIVLFIWNKISLDDLTNGLILSYLLALIGILIYTYHLKQLNLSINYDFIKRPLFKRIINFSLFSLFSGLGVMLSFRLDSIMVSTILDFKSNGAYNIAAFIGNAIAIPGIALASISSPLVSNAFKQNDLKQINFLYRQTSINLLVFSMLFFILVIASIEDLFRLMPSRDFNIETGFYIVLILGASRVLEMATSINSQIINYSSYYRFNLVALAILAVVNIILNLIFIPKYLIIGAAMATFISLGLFNLIKFIFILIKFKMQPFSKSVIPLLIISAISFSVYWIFPGLESPLLNIIIKSVIIAAIYIPLVLYFEISKDVNELLYAGLEKVRNFISNSNEK